MIEELLKRAEVRGTCWVWIGAHCSDGYGHKSLGGIKHRVHRLAYEAAIGPIPTGLEIDHLCGVRACFNPAHLEAVTHRENLLRGGAFAGVNARKQHCPQGHRLAGDNLANHAARRGRRVCRICLNERARMRWKSR